MRKYITIIIAGILIASCGSGSARASKERANTTPQQPTRYGYKVKNTYPHATTSYTQGLIFDNGVLWEGTGEYGHSMLQQIDLTTGKTNVVARLPRSEFGEGITILGDTIYQLTWTSNKAYAYNRLTGKKIKEFTYQGEGWGLTTDGQRLYMSTGSEYIYTIDPTTFRRLGRVAVTSAGEAVTMLNELEWIDGRIWANIYTTDLIAIIDPTTGVVEGLIDLTGILPAEDIRPNTDVLNGIAHDPATGRTLVTGKRWDKIFEIEIIKQ